MVAFQDALDGVRCSILIQREFAKYNQQHEDERIMVHIGLHTGEPARDEDNFYGTDVNLAARIADDVAKAGQIVVSSRLRELVESAGDITFSKATEVELKGLGMHQVFQVDW